MFVLIQRLSSLCFVSIQGFSSPDISCCGQLHAAPARSTAHTEGSPFRQQSHGMAAVTNSLRLTLKMVDDDLLDAVADAPCMVISISKYFWCPPDRWSRSALLSGMCADQSSGPHISCCQPWCFMPFCAWLENMQQLLQLAKSMQCIEMMTGQLLRKVQRSGKRQMCQSKATFFVWNAMSCSDPGKEPICRCGSSWLLLL